MPKQYLVRAGVSGCTNGEGCLMASLFGSVSLYARGNMSLQEMFFDGPLSSLGVSKHPRLSPNAWLPCSGYLMRESLKQFLSHSLFLNRGGVTKKMQKKGEIF